MSLETTNTQNDTWADLDLNDTALQTLLDNPLEERSNTSRLRDGTQHAGFDNNMGESWIYPNNLPCRSYQMSIVQTALYHNTLVVLPTGLGKTFIAAVVMYNFYRWYPRGKIIFMAPTRPLVNQQIEACQNVMPFPRRDMIELTGKLNRSKRIEMWKTKRVFFATPQVVQSDIIGGRQQVADSVDESSFKEAEEANRTNFPFEVIKLIVIDEAHRAKGKYAYTEVAQALTRNTKYFRVLALSATPGRTVEDVAEVCRNLLISRVEVRWDTSLDVLPYVHKRTMDTVVVSIGDKIKEIREELLCIVDPYLRQLTDAGVLSGSLTSINRNFLLYEQKRFRDRSFHSGRHPHHSAVTSNFAICISLYHALELLERHGLRVFLNNFEEDEEGKNKFVLQMDRRLYDLVEKLKTYMGPNPFQFSAAPMTNGKIAEIPKDLDFGHPKFEKTRECLMKHFEKNKDSRAIVFCEYRESVMLIYRMLLQHVPLLRPRCFVGQGGTGCLRALTQKQQIQIMNDFRSGKSNILIATSIGEEGIDVGEVELIVCFDISTSNPMRFVQRIGRTGRKKNGHVIMMVTEGREQQLLREVLSNKDQINKKLLTSSVIQQSLYKYAPRLVPTEFKPKCIQTFVKPPSDDEEVNLTKAKKNVNKAVSPKKVAQDLRKFFQKKPKELDKEDLPYFESQTQITQIKPGLQTQQNIVNKLDKMKNLFKDLQSPLATQTQKPTKSPHTKLNNSLGSIKDFFKDSQKTTCIKRSDDLNKSLNNSQTSIENASVTTIDLCEDDADENHVDAEVDSLAANKSNAERLGRLEKLLRTSITSKKVLKRADIKDLSFHLKSPELSREMKKLLLTMRPEFLKENFEQMQVLQALHANDTADYTVEEKTVRELNHIILELFEGMEKVEHFLDACELDKYKPKCLESDSETEEEDPHDMENFQKKLDTIIKDQGEAERHNNYNWIQQRFRETKFYKETINVLAQNKVQESMVYDNFAEPDDENTFSNFEDCSIIESKYCSQWQEFNKPDIIFKSTPVQRPANRLSNREQTSTKTSSLTKLEETKEEHEIEKKNNENFNTSAAGTKQIQNMLLLLENKLKETSFNEAKTASPQTDLNEAERNSFEIDLLEAEDFHLPDEEELIKAAEEAESRFTQNQLNETKKDASSLRKLNTIPELQSIIDNVTEISNPSLNSTPEVDLSTSDIKKREIYATPTQLKQLTANLNLQQELDIDMEAFMEPFPEEQELLGNTPTSSRKESAKEISTNTSISTLVRESPNLFAEEHTKGAIQKPSAIKKPSLANKLSEKQLNLQKCQSSLNPTSFNSFKSPQKRIFSTQTHQEPLKSPSNRLATDNNKYEKSPSIFDMYIQNTKGKSKLPKSLTNSTKILTSSVKMSAKKEDHSLKKSPAISSASQQDESIITLRNRKGIASKRKIFDSDSEHEDDDERQLNGLSVINSKSNEDTDSDFEEIAATQIPNESSIFHQRRKRRRFNSFLQQEAKVSGSDHSEDEAELTIDGYDSIVAPSDEEDPDQASTSHMQAVYLQSLKSPLQRRGTFKIPPTRVYNDRSHIFSQAVIPEDTYSQYLPDSFVVNEENCTITNNAEMSLCPLERAEKILKERRRAKKLSLLEKKDNKEQPKRRAKYQIIENSSDDEDFE